MSARVLHRTEHWLLAQQLIECRPTLAQQHGLFVQQQSVGGINRALHRLVNPQLLRRFPRVVAVFTPRNH